MTIKKAPSRRKKLSPTSPKEDSSRNEIFFTSSEIVSCDGNGINFGHPKVYLKAQEDCPTECPYCSKKFQKTGEIRYA